MFTIYGGKDAFDQWDQGQRVVCQGMKAGDKVTFTNCTGETHPMLSYSYEGIVVCDVPNDLLMKASPILVDMCRNHEHRTRLLVMPRAKPEGYEYVDNTVYPQESTGGGGGATVLWENPNPTTRVDEGTGLSVSVDISPYSIIQILFRRSVTNSTLYSGWMLSAESECTTPFNEVQADDVGQITIASGSVWTGYSDGQFVFWGAETTLYTPNQNISGKWLSTNNFSGDDMIPVAIIGHCPN